MTRSDFIVINIVIMKTLNQPQGNPEQVSQDKLFDIEKKIDGETAVLGEIAIASTWQTEEAESKKEAEAIKKAKEQKEQKEAEYKDQVSSLLAAAEQEHKLAYANKKDFASQTDQEITKTLGHLYKSLVYAETGNDNIKRLVPDIAQQKDYYDREFDSWYDRYDNNPYEEYRKPKPNPQVADYISLDNSQYLNKKAIREVLKNIATRFV